MKNLLLISFLIVTLQICHATNTTQQCPPLPFNCRCNHKKNKNGIRISCNDLKYALFDNLPKDMSMDIDLSGNLLTSINSSSFPNPNKIRKLVMKENFIKDIGDDTFQGFTALKKLDISGNNLVQLTEKTFQGLEKTLLTTLDLKENRIISISRRAFSGLSIDRLILNKQLNIYGSSAELTAYPDFLSFSVIKQVDLDENNLLCDCNLNWLANWLKRSKDYRISPSTRCKYPKQLQGRLVLDIIMDPDWQCGKYISSFTIPQFQLYPSNDQILFKKDPIMISCQSTWIERGHIVWLKNGIMINPQLHDSRVHVRHLINFTLASYTSTLFIDSLMVTDSCTITCELRVKDSGNIRRDVNIHVFSDNKCPAGVTKTDRGVISWPTTYMGGVMQRSCPHGGLKTLSAYRSCQDGNWSSVSVENCFFDNAVTKRLQQFSAEAELRNVKSVFTVGKLFSLFFQKNYHRMKTRYDLYFTYKTLYAIMKTYELTGENKYFRLFWGSIGVIADHFMRRKALQEVLYGSTAARRFRDLVENFVEQESKETVTFSMDGYDTMTALSVTQQLGFTVQCYVLLPSKSPKRSMQVICPQKRIDSLSKKSYVIFQVATQSSSTTSTRVTTLLHFSPAFFQPSQKIVDRQLRTPVVGIEVKELVSNQPEKNISIAKPTLIIFKTDSEQVDPRLVFWKNHQNGSGTWEEMKNCSMVIPTLLKQANTSAFDCSLPSHFFRKMEYFTLSVRKVAPLQIKPKYMEPALYIGSALACLLLVITLVIYIAIRPLRYNRSDAAILMNECLVLIIIELLFSWGIHRTDNDLLCKGAAVALHYFFLCALLWLGCGGVVLIRLMKKKDRGAPNQYDPVIKYYLVAWGIPLIVCSITVAYDRGNYGTSDYCWLTRGASLGACIVPACLTILIDLGILCYLQVLVNRVYPEPLDDYIDDEEEELVSRDQCNSKTCKYKMKAFVPLEQRFPPRQELICYLQGCLSVLLLFTMTFTCVVMMYFYKGTSTKYLYYFFAYAASTANFSLGLSILFFHCIKRKNLVKYFREAIAIIRQCRAIKIPEEAEKVEQVPSPTISLKVSSRNGHMYGPSDIVSEVSNFVDMTHGVYGLSDQVQSDGSQIIATVRLEKCQSYDGRGESVQSEGVDMKAHLNNISTPTPDVDISSFNASDINNGRANLKSQSEMSEAEKLSNGGHNSIGECSLTSSRNQKRVRPTNPDIPETIKAFVPENWRPVKRRGKSKGASYYPYYLNDSAPITASLAYSSNNSSIASTTVSGVPLYINKKRAANNLAMYSDLFNQRRAANPMGAVRQPLPPISNHNTAVHVTTPPSNSYSHQKSINPGFIQKHNSSMPLTVLNPVQEQNISLLGSEVLVNTEPQVNNNNVKLKHVQVAEIVESEESEIEEPIKIAPVIYICMPHVSIKQFEKPFETSV